MRTVVVGQFEWDAAKAASNLRKHGVAFEEAISVLESADTLEQPDPTDTRNVLTLGFSREARVLLVVSTETTNRTRIISARRATAHERRAFNQR